MDLGSWVKLQVRLYLGEGTEFDRMIVGGDGAYADLHAVGGGVGISTGVEGEVLDLYSGKAHIDWPTGSTSTGKGALSLPAMLMMLNAKLPGRPVHPRPSRRVAPALVPSSSNRNRYWRTW